MDDLVNQKLVYLVGRMNIDANDFQLSLGSLVFKLMRIEILPEDESFDQYMIMAERGREISIEKRTNFLPLAEEIYAYLCTLPKEKNQN